ncbi:uncharacterized protein UDID_19315 [Ustilago sp. UG-2017a]|nr:uncharacterized protein UDID_19315 [Ustilago sp. UG-2017a]
MLSTKIIGLCITALVTVQVHAVDDADPGVRVQIPERLLLPVGEQNLARDGRFQLVPSYPPQHEWPTYLPAAQPGPVGASSSRQPGPVGAGEGGASSSRQPEEREVSSQPGRVPSDPPLQLGGRWFHMQSYPLDMPELQKFYHNDNFEPFDFEQLHLHHYQTSGGIYRPDPQVLHAIHDSIWPVLERHGLNQNGVHPGYTLKHGEYLWPPFRQGPGGLDPRPNLAVDLRTRITDRTKEHSQTSPKLYRMEVNVDGKKRQVLVLNGRSQNYLNEGVRLPQSELWLFYENAKVNGNRIPKVAFLGASFLPGGAKDMLVGSGVVRAADFARRA